MILPPSLVHTETNGSLDALAALQIRLRDERLTALALVRIEESRQVAFAYANGVLAGSYALEEGKSRPILQAELSSVWGGSDAAVQHVAISAKFGRMAWLAFESRAQSRREVRAEAEWGRQVEEWRAARFTGLAEIASNSAAGFLWLERGEIVSDESAFIGYPNLEAFLSDPPFTLTASLPDVESNAWQCFSLRQCGSKWASGILARFQQVAGAKFAQAVAREITQLIQPWQWHMRVENGRLRDEHFFPRAAAATNAYRSIFMGMGAQMGFVIGNMLTQRILSEMYYELDGEERAVLGSNRLIPAAFSE